MKWFKKISLSIIVILATATLLILITGNSYLFNGIKNTYLKGKTTPDITDINIFPTKKIEVSNTPYNWSYSPNYNSYKFTQEEKVWLNELETACLLVIRNDKIIAEHYWDEFSDTTATNSFSMAKSVVGLLIGIAIEENKIKSIDEPIGNYLPEYKASKITIKHLLWMSSGLDWSESGANPFSNNAEAYYGDELEELVLNQKVITEPGITFNYLSGNTQLLALILKQATRKSISDYASEKIWQKIGSEHPAFWSLDNQNGIEKAFCCLYAIPKDYAKLGKLILDNGYFNGESIVPEDYLKQSLTPAPILEEDGSKNERYGLHWWIGNHRSEPFYHAQGLYGQYIIVLPQSNTMIVRTGRKREAYGKGKLPNDIYTYIDIASKM